MTFRNGREEVLWMHATCLWDGADIERDGDAMRQRIEECIDAATREAEARHVRLHDIAREIIADMNNTYDGGGPTAEIGVRLLDRLRAELDDTTTRAEADASYRFGRNDERNDVLRWIGTHTDATREDIQTAVQHGKHDRRVDK